MQTNFPFLSVMPAPKNAPDDLVVRIRSEAEAVAVSLRARDFKQAWYAAQLGKSEAYISQIANGRRRVPDWFVEPFCVLSGSNLLKQYRDLQDALAVVRDRNDAKANIARMADQMRRAA